MEHPVWFCLTLTFFYLPHFGRVWSSNMRELLTKFLFHGFKPVNKLEKGGQAYIEKHLPRWAQVVIFMDANCGKFGECTHLGRVILVLYWLFRYAFKTLLFIAMPLLITFRQMRVIPIMFRLEAIRCNQNKNLTVAGMASKSTYTKIKFAAKVFKEPERLVRENLQQ